MTTTASDDIGSFSRADMPTLLGWEHAPATGDNAFMRTFLNTFMQLPGGPPALELPLTDDGGVLEDFLLVGLEVSPFVSAYPRKDAIALATSLAGREADSSSLDSEAASLVALREGVDVVIGGTVSRGRDGITVTVGSTSTSGQQKVFSVSETVDSDAAVPGDRIWTFRDELPSLLRLHPRFERHRQFLRNATDPSERGAGYWFWKPLLVLGVLQNDDDVPFGSYVIYTDGDRPDVIGYAGGVVERMAQRGHDFAIQQWQGGLETHHTKGDTFEHFGVYDHQKDRLPQDRFNDDRGPSSHCLG